MCHVSFRAAITACVGNAHCLCEERTRLMRGARTAYAWSAHGLCAGRTRLMRGTHTAYARDAHGLCAGSSSFSVSVQNPATSPSSTAVNALPLRKVVIAHFLRKVRPRPPRAVLGKRSRLFPKLVVAHHHKNFCHSVAFLIFLRIFRPKYLRTWLLYRA